MAKFHKIELEIGRNKGYGSYTITAKYKGKEIKAHTNDSECFDWLEDDSNKSKHQDAKRHAYGRIREAYENKF